MRQALPNAAFIGFTGTPLMAGEEKTREVFGDYVSVYSFRQAIEDNATVPLYYEARIPELQLTNKDLGDDLAAVIEEADLDEDQQKKVEREFSRQYHLITREDRLDTIAADVVTHFLGLNMEAEQTGSTKGMVVAIDKLTAVRMHDKVKSAWARKKKELEKRLGGTAYEDKPASLSSNEAGKARRSGAGTRRADRSTNDALATNGPRHHRSHRRVVSAGTPVARTTAAAEITASATALARMTTAPMYTRRPRKRTDGGVAR